MPRILSALNARLAMCAMIAGSILCATAAPNVAAQRVVHETSAQWKSAKLLTLTPQATWCKSGDDPGCDFKSIDDALLLPDGGLIASSTVGPINHFSPDGAFIKALGSSGKGPGEYLFIVHPQLVKEQLVWFDNRQMRSTSVSLSGTPGPITLTMLPQTTENLYAVKGTVTVLDVPVATVGDTVEGVYRTVPASGAPQIFAKIRTPALFAPGTNFRAASGPFAPRIVAGVGVNGDIAHTNGGRYVVDIFPLKQTAWRLEVEAPLRPVTQKDRDSVEARALKAFRVPNVASLPPIVRAQFDIKRDWFPSIMEIFMSRDGTVWIRPQSTATEATARWDVFSSSGVRMGRAQLPLKASVRDGERDWILVVELNGDDVPTVIKYKVQ
ncbi:MAG: hypothetical protein ABJB74_19060 [Gemmatimonas sp.]